MAEFLTTSGIAHHIENIIKKASSQITLVTPYLKLTSNFIERLKDADEKGIQITILYGKDQLSQHAQGSIDQIKNLNLYFYQNLHAKCYYNDSLMVLASMNLYEFSEKNNREMGILIHSDEYDQHLYEDAVKEVNSIIKSSEVIRTCIQEYQIEEEEEDSRPYIKLIQKEFQKKFPYDQIELNDETHYPSLTVKNFPWNNIELTISSKIEWDFKLEYYKVGKLKKAVLREIRDIFHEYRFRCYWNRKRLSIYMPSSFNHEDNAESNKQIFEAFIFIIDTCSQSIRKVLNGLDD